LDGEIFSNCDEFQKIFKATWGSELNKSENGMPNNVDVKNVMSTSWIIIRLKYVIL